MPVHYILDNREKKLQELFTSNSIKFESKQLDSGDILILYGKEEIKASTEQLSKEANKLLKTENSTQEIKVVTIERKSYTDLKSSMADGRYHEQKSRYMTLPRGSIYYILENNDPTFSQLDKKQFLGMYVHTMIRDGISVFHTSSINDTFQFIIKIGETLDKFGLDLTTEHPKSINDSQIKKKKCKGKDVYKQQLCCFPGISSTKADSIIACYINMTDLMDAIKNNTFKVKGIGSVLLQNIKDGLYFD